MVALGGTIGAGLFLGVGDGLRVAGPVLPFIFLGAAALAASVALALGEMAVARGGDVTFVALSARYLGPRSAFVQGWGYWASAVLASMAQLTAAGRFLADLAPAAPAWAVAVAGLVMLTAVNRSAVRTFGAVEAALASVKVGLLAAVAVAGAAAVVHPALAPDAGLAGWLRRPFAPAGGAGILAALPLVLFAFGNTELVALASVDLDDARRTLAPTVRRFVVRLAVLHVGVASALLLLLSPADLEATRSPFATLLGRAGVPGGAAVMDGVLVCVMLSSCNACLYGAARVLRALGAEGCAPSWLMTEDPNGSPRSAIWTTGLAVSAVIFISFITGPRTFTLLLGAAATFGLVNWALFLAAHRRFRRTAGRSRFASSTALLASGIALAAIALQAPYRAAALLALAAIAGLAGLSQLLVAPSDGQRGE